MPDDGAVATEIRDLSHDGRGVADVDGRRVFVAGALPDERVMLQPRRRRRRHQEAELLSVLEPSRHRVAAGCLYFGRCGGCAVQHMDYEAQLQFKRNVAVQAFNRIAGLEPRTWLATVHAGQWSYRRKARLGVKHVEAKHRVLVGFRERAAPLITDMDHCPVLAPPVGTALGDLAQTIAATSIRSRLPQAEVAIGDDAAAVVLRVLDPPSADDVGAFRRFGARHGIDVHLQTGGPGTIEPIDAHARRLHYALPDFGIDLEFEPTDFIQVNAEINARLVSAVVELAAPAAGERVLDLYCGIGNLSLPLARSGATVLGVEGDPALVARAARNADANGIRNARFVAADLTLADWSFLAEAWDLLVLDPPRTGADEIVSNLASMSPSRIVYVSCHPATLARDARTLVERHGYELVSARVFDMFPHTHHVEVMAYFERRSP